MRRCLPSLVFASEHEVGTRCGLISERTGADPGCWIIANQPLRTPTKPQTFWHLDAYPTHSRACRTAKGAAQGRRRVLGRQWLLSIEDTGRQCPPLRARPVRTRARSQ